ncbi:MAG: hypothetical protein NC923_05270 [Candidatus Omnitrophica bacterium]|nr:hypothetical protein [Candidatus Omnitrophota bacterium]
MEEKARALIVLLTGLIIAAVGIGGAGFYFLQKEHAKNVELVAKLDEITTKLRLTDSMLEDSKKTIVDLQKKLSDATQNIDKLNAELQQEKSMRQETLAKLDTLNTELQQHKNLREELEKKLADAQESAKNTQTQLQELQAKKAELEKKVSELETKTKNIELGNIVVSTESPVPTETKSKKTGADKVKPEEKKAKSSPPPVSGDIEGKVLVVNKEYDFVVINIGAQDGLRLGDQFSVFHDNEYVGDIKVEKLQDNMAAAGFLSPDLKSAVNEGDRVVKKGK